MSALLASTPNQSQSHGVLQTLEASSLKGHPVPGSPSGNYFHVFRMLGDPSVILMIPPTGLGMSSLVYPLKPNYPNFVPWKPTQAGCPIVEAGTDETMAVVTSVEELVYERKNPPVFAKFRR